MAGVHNDGMTTVASMRPPEFTGGNQALPDGGDISRRCASMRPPEFTGGNQALPDGGDISRRCASMRPPEFTGGNALGIRPETDDDLQLQ